MNDSNLTRKNRSLEKERADKALLRIMKERSRLLRAKWNAPLVELEEPFQRGWVRFFVLSTRAKHRRDSKKLETLLKFLNYKQFSRRLDFCVRQGKSKKWIPMRQSLPRFHVHEILRRGIPDDLLRYLTNFRYESLGDRKNAEKLRRLGYPWKFGVGDSTLFELVIEPHWITHQRVVMPEVETRLSEIEAHLYATCGWERYRRLKGHRNWRYYDYGLRLDEKRMQQIDREWREFLTIDATAQNEGTVHTVPFSLITILKFFWFKFASPT